MKMRKFTAIALALMLVLGSVASVFAADREAQATVFFKVKAVDKNGEPMSGIIMELTSYREDGVCVRTTDENGYIDFGGPAGPYRLDELGYEDKNIVYNEFWFSVNLLGEIKEDELNKKVNVDYEIIDYNTIVWYCYDYTNQYSVSVNLDGSDFDGDRVEVVAADGTVVKAWSLEDDGPLVANLAPGAYTLKEIVEINGYEMPMISNIMVGGANIVPAKPEVIDPMDFIDPEILPNLPDFVYDDFQKWINQL